MAKKIVKPIEALAPITEGQDLSLVTMDKFKEQLDALRAETKITDDKGKVIEFEGEVKETFIAACEDGYPVFSGMLHKMYECGAFLHGARAKLKPLKLYYTWLRYAGIPERTAQSFTQAYESYRESLPQFSHLGIRKLLAASRLPDSTNYLQKNLDEVTKLTADEFESKVRAILKKVTHDKRKQGGKPRGRKPSYEIVGGVRLRLSKDKTRIIIEGSGARAHKALFEDIKAWLSQKNASSATVADATGASAD